MATPRPFSRIAKYDPDNPSKFYPNEIVEHEGKVQVISEDGSSLEPVSSSFNIVDSDSTIIASVDTNTESVTLPKATTTSQGLVKLSSAAAKAPASAGSPGSSEKVSREDHAHPVQTSVSGNAGTATKLANSRSISLTGVEASAASFDGSANVEIEVTSVPATIVTGLADVATTGSYNDLSDTPTIPSIPDVEISDTTSGTYVTGVSSSGHKITLTRGTPVIPAASSTAPKSAGTAAAGTSTSYSREDHVHPVQTTVSGNAGTATKLSNARSIGLSGVTATTQSFDGSKDITIPVTAVPSSIVTGLATVATSGSYNDLSNKPTIPTIPDLSVDSDNSTGEFITDIGVDGHKITLSRGTPTIPTLSKSDTGAGNAVTGIAVDGHKITVTKGSTFLTAETQLSKSDTGTGNAVTGIAVDGHSITVTKGSTFLTSETQLSKSDTGNGNAVTGIAVDGHKITVTKGSTFLTAHPTISTGSDSTNSVTPGYKGTFTAIDSVTRDANGHVTKINTKTVTMPSEQTSVTGNAGTATKLAAERNINFTGAFSGSNKFDGSKDITFDVTSLDGSKITGIIPLASIPKAAQERLIDVPNDASRLSTSLEAQNGDVIRVLDTGKMYFVVDDTAFGNEEAFAEFTAGTASSVAWSGVSGKPSFATVATSGSYNDLTNKPTIPTIPTLSKSDTGTGNAVTGIAVDGHKITVTKGSTFLTSETQLSKGTTEGSGNAVTDITVSGHKITLTKGSTFLTSHQTIPSVTANTSGSGNAVTAVTASGHTLTVTKGTTFLTAHPTITTSTDSTSTANLTQGGTFTAIDSVTRDTNGHVTKVNTKTVTMPVFYGTCSTAAATAAKVVTCSGFVLATGSRIAVKFTNTNSAASPTLNVNGTGAKSVMRYGTTAATTYMWYAGGVVDFVYDGTNWVMESTSIATTTYYGMTKLTSSTSSTSTSLAASAAAVKAAYDLANTANTTATTANTTATTANTNASNALSTANAKATTATYNATVGTTWTGSAAPYSQTITVSGITASDNPIVDVVLSSTYATAQTQLEDYGKIYRITTAANSITVYATDTTSASLSIQLKCIR